MIGQIITYYCRIECSIKHLIVGGSFVGEAHIHTQMINHYFDCYGLVWFNACCKLTSVRLCGVSCLMFRQLVFFF